MRRYRGYTGRPPVPPGPTIELRPSMVKLLTDARGGGGVLTIADDAQKRPALLAQVVWGEFPELRLRWPGDEDQSTERVFLEFTKQPKGGERVWFSCPCCGRRCALLRLRAPYLGFSCAKCQQRYQR